MRMSQRMWPTFDRTPITTYALEYLHLFGFLIAEAYCSSKQAFGINFKILLRYMTCRHGISLHRNDKRKAKQKIFGSWLGKTA